MIIDKYELMKELEREIKDNLFDMDSLLDLMTMEEYENDTDVLEEAFDTLKVKTEGLKEEYYKLCNELDIIDELFSEFAM